MKYELHPLCTLFPRIEGAEFDALVADVKANGLRESIVLHDGMILDGGNRYRACVQAGVTPKFKEFSGANLVTFVLSANLHRRHLSAGQQAAIVASAQDWAKAQTVGKPKSVNVDPLATVEQRAARSGASRSTQKMADKVAKADPELIKQVGLGEVSLPKAVAKVEGKPPKPTKAQPEDEPAFEPSEAEIRFHLEQEAADQKAMALILDSNEPLAALKAEYERQSLELATVKASRDGFMNRCNELIRRVKTLRAKLDKLEREHGKSV